MKKKMLIVVNTFESGGIGKYVQKILPSLNREYDVEVLSRDEIRKENVKSLKIKKANRYKLPKFFDIWPLKEFFFFLYGFFFLRKNNRFDKILLNYPFFVPSNCKKTCEVVSVVHAMHKQYLSAKTPRRFIFFALKFFHWLLMPLDNYRMKISDKVVFVSLSGFDSVSGINKIYLPNPLDRKIFWKNKKVHKKINVAFIARDDPYKGKDFLERALAYFFIENYSRYRSLEFYIIGMDKLNRQYPNTHLLGNLSFGETEKALKEIHLFFSPSYLENTPNVVFEALFSSVVPLVSDVGDCKQILGDEFTFVSCDFDDFLKKFGLIIRNYSRVSSKIPVKDINLRYDYKSVNKKLMGVLNNENK